LKAAVFAFVHAEQDRFKVKALCQRHRVTRAGYYAWCRRKPSLHTRQDERLLARIRAIFEASEGTYGSPRIHAALQQAGLEVGRKRVARLMRNAALKARSARIYRRMPGTRRLFSGIPNRVLELKTTATGQVWVGDVTYLRSAGRWRYLAVVLDRHSRRVLGWSLGVNRDLALTMDALNRAHRRRSEQPGLIFHSDRGVEYSAYAFRARLAALGITQSMKRPREIGDNVFVESFFHSMKADVIHGRTFDDDRSLDQTVSRYIRRYNRSRLHSSLGYRSPIDYEHAA
jgi:transposase InsO family protein